MRFASPNSTRWTPSNSTQCQTKLGSLSTQADTNHLTASLVKDQRAKVDTSRQKSTQSFGGKRSDVAKATQTQTKIRFTETPCAVLPTAGAVLPPGGCWLPEVALSDGGGSGGGGMGSILPILMKVFTKRDVLR